MSISPLQSVVIQPPIQTGKIRVVAFSLVEVALALGILGFALISIVGLVSIGLKGSRDNMQRSVETQILDWAQGFAKMEHEEYGLDDIDETKLHQFDHFGLYLRSRSGSHPEAQDLADCIYTATLKPVEKPLPGSTQSLWGVQVVIRNAQSHENNILGKNALWFSK